VVPLLQEEEALHAVQLLLQAEGLLDHPLLEDQDLHLNPEPLHSQDHQLQEHLLLLSWELKHQHLDQLHQPQQQRDLLQLELEHPPEVLEALLVFVLEVVLPLHHPVLACQDLILSELKLHPKQLQLRQVAASLGHLKNQKQNLLMDNLPS
jgi:hypothetical protein